MANAAPFQHYLLILILILNFWWVIFWSADREYIHHVQVLWFLSRWRNFHTLRNAHSDPSRARTRVTLDHSTDISSDLQLEAWCFILTFDQSSVWLYSLTRCLLQGSSRSRASVGPVTSSHFCVQSGLRYWRGCEFSDTWVCGWILAECLTALFPGGTLKGFRCGDLQICMGRGCYRLAYRFFSLKSLCSILLWRVSW